MNDIKNKILGFNAKDSLSNFAAALIAIGSVGAICTEFDILPKSYRIRCLGSIAIGQCLIGIATGKSSDLKTGQIDAATKTPNKW